MKKDMDEEDLISWVYGLLLDAWGDNEDLGHSTFEFELALRVKKWGDFPYGSV